MENSQYYVCAEMRNGMSVVSGEGTRLETLNKLKAMRKAGHRDFNIYKRNGLDSKLVAWAVGNRGRLHLVGERNDRS